MFTTYWQFIPPPATITGHDIFFCLVVHHTGWIICSYFCFMEGICHFSFTQELAGRHPQKDEVCQHWACEEAGQSAVPSGSQLGLCHAPVIYYQGTRFFTSLSQFSCLKNIYFGLLVQKASKSWLESVKAIR